MRKEESWAAIEALTHSRLRVFGPRGFGAISAESSRNTQVLAITAQWRLMAIVEAVAATGFRLLQKKGNGGGDGR